MNPVPYHMRHSGASSDLVLALRGLQDVKRRGRWRADSSLLRYTKGGRLGDQFARLNLKVQGNCETCHSAIGEILRGRLPELQL